MEHETGTAVLLGLDIGTTNCKLVAYTAGGEILATGYAGYDVNHPAPGRAELDPADLIAAVTGAFHQVSPGLAGISDVSLAISAQGEAFVPVDAAGHALSAAPISVDMRGQDAISAFDARKDARAACALAGQKLNALSSLAKLLWMRECASDVLEKTSQVLCVGEYVMRVFGIEPRMDYSMAARMGLLDNLARQWSRELLALAGLPGGILPPLAPSGTFVGTIDLRMAGRLGLDVPVSVYTGGHDQACAMLGAGLVDPGTGLYSIGTTEAIAISLENFRPDVLARNIDTYPHVASGRFVALMGSQSGGRLLEWLKVLRGATRTEELFEDLPDLPSAATVVAHFAGSGSLLDDEQARGVMAGLSFDSTPAEIIHAILEGITLEQANALATAADLGIAANRLRAVGGGSRSPVWMQIKADIMGLEIDCLESTETACAGAAILAGMGSGVLPSLDEAIGRFVSIGRTYSPRPEFTAIYAKKRALYHEIYLSHRRHRRAQQELSTSIEALKAEMRKRS